MSAVVAPVVDVEILAENLQRIEESAWSHGQRCRFSECRTCLTLMEQSRVAFDALARVAGESYALDVLAGVG